VVLSGKQKAAMLLMSLDATTAAELLKGVDPDMVQELAVEVAYLDASGHSDQVRSTEVARQFCESLIVEKKSDGFELKGFLSTMLTSTIGAEKADRLQTQIDGLLQKRDPFITVRSAESKALSSILGKEHPQAIAVVLSELSARKSSEVLALLDEGVRISVVTRLTGSDAVSLEARMRIAELVCKQLDAMTASGDGGAAGGVVGQSQSLRKVAIMLRNLETEIRNGLMKSIKKKDSEAAEQISELMVLWEDIVEIEDRSLQQAMREVDMSKMALALVEADDATIKKIRSNISERAAETIDEETSLMSSPKAADIETARDEIVAVFREINDKGDLSFQE
jgi:flagellar motor switch protein FliG